MTVIASSGLLIAAGLINLAPLIGVVSAAKIETLYGLHLADQPDLEILLRHRAVLFGLLGAAMLWGAIDRQWFWPVLGAGLISMTAYAALAVAIEGSGPPLRFVLTMDLIGIACALAAGALRVFFNAGA